MLLGDMTVYISLKSIFLCQGRWALMTLLFEGLLTLQTLYLGLFIYKRLLNFVPVIFIYFQNLPKNIS